MPGLDANDLLYQVNASRNYDPSPNLGKIKVPVMWMNWADDFINPPELGIAEREAKRLMNGRFILIPASEKTHGHGTHTWAVIWKDQLAELLQQTARWTLQTKPCSLTRRKCFSAREPAAMSSLRSFASP